MYKKRKMIFNRFLGSLKFQNTKKKRCFLEIANFWEVRSLRNRKQEQSSRKMENFQEVENLRY